MPLGPMALLPQVSSAAQRSSQDMEHPQSVPHCHEEGRQKKPGKHQELLISPSSFQLHQLSCFLSLQYHLIEIQVIPFSLWPPGSPTCLLHVLEAWEKTLPGPGHPKAPFPVRVLAAIAKEREMVGEAGMQSVSADPT